MKPVRWLIEAVGDWVLPRVAATIIMLLPGAYWVARAYRLVRRGRR